MERKSAYSGLAEWFEILNDDCGLTEWSEYLISELKQYPVYKGLDMGCGSGYFTRAFSRFGYEMTGADLSRDMLIKAEELSQKEGKRIPFLQLDICSFRTPNKYDFVTAINDCINYIPKNKLKSAFACVYSALNKDGIFIFDISSERKFREKIANTVCADDREDITYLSFNSLEGDREKMDITLFVRRSDGAFERFDETHIQYVYSEEEIENALKETGFILIKVEGHLKEDKLKSDRISFVAQKRKRINLKKNPEAQL